MADQERVDALVLELEARGVSEDALDELVHDNAQEDTLPELNSTDDPNEQEQVIAGSEHDASAINNGGFADQVAYLLDAGLSEEEIIEAADQAT